MGVALLARRTSTRIDGPFLGSRGKWWNARSGYMQVGATAVSGSQGRKFTEEALLYHFSMLEYFIVDCHKSDWRSFERRALQKKANG
jgi:hypothetical protein